MRCAREGMYTASGMQTHTHTPIWTHKHTYMRASMRKRRAAEGLRAMMAANYDEHIIGIAGNHHPTCASAPRQRAGMHNLRTGGPSVCVFFLCGENVKRNRTFAHTASIHHAQPEPVLVRRQRERERERKKRRQRDSAHRRLLRSDANSRIHPFISHPPPSPGVRISVHRGNGELCNP